MKEMENNKPETKIDKNKMYPVIYNGREWKRKDCDDLFVDFYNTPLALNPLGGVYVNGGLWVYPDGKLEEY